MKYILSFLILSFNIFGMDTTSCDTASEKPKVVRTNKAPELGQYIKVRPYFVTAGKNDPYTDEILYFIIAQELNKKDKNIGNSLDYMRFHKYFKQQLAVIEKQREIDKSYEPIEESETYPIIRNFFNQNWLNLSVIDFDKVVDENKEKIKNIKDIFAMKSNTTYYEIYPLDAQVTLDETSTLPTVTLKSGTTALQVTIAASDLILYSSKADETKEKLSLINSNLTEIKYIQSVLPSSGAPLKENLKKYINQELE